MHPIHGRRVLLAALLAMAVSGPTWANDGVNTTQQTLVGQTAIEVAALQSNPTVVDETYATETNGRIATPRSRPKVTAVPPPPPSVVRRPIVSASYYRPSLILGIGY